MRLLAIAGSLRTASLNCQLLTCAIELATSAGAEVTELRLKDYPLPPYDGDIEDASGLPAECMAICDAISAADGLLIASPEYNQSVAGVIKNVVDWVSRARPVPLKNKSALLMSASPGLVGGNRGLWALRVPLELLGTHVYPGMFSLASADKAFSPEGRLLDAAQEQRLKALIEAYLERLARNL